MATIKLCDWTKERLANDEETTQVVIGGEEFEVGEAGKKALLEQLEGETPPQAPKVQVQEKVVFRDAPPPTLQAAPPGGVQIEADDPFEPGPNSMPQPVQAGGGGAQPPVTTAVAAGDAGDDDLIEIPDDPHKRLKAQKPRVAQRIIEEATKFDEGSLPTLTMGAKQQKEAMRKLRALEERENEKLRRKAPNGVNVNPDMRNKPGGY